MSEFENIQRRAKARDAAKMAAGSEDEQFFLQTAASLRSAMGEQQQRLTQLGGAAGATGRDTVLGGGSKDSKDSADSGGTTSSEEQARRMKGESSGDVAVAKKRQSVWGEFMKKGALDNEMDLAADAAGEVLKRPEHEPNLQYAKACLESNFIQTACPAIEVFGTVLPWASFAMGQALIPFNQDRRFTDKAGVDLGIDRNQLQSDACLLRFLSSIEGKTHGMNAKIARDIYINTYSKIRGLKSPNILLPLFKDPIMKPQGEHDDPFKFNDNRSRAMRQLRYHKFIQRKREEIRDERMGDKDPIDLASPIVRASAPKEQDEDDPLVIRFKLMDSVLSPEDQLAVRYWDVVGRQSGWKQADQKIFSDKIYPTAFQKSVSDATCAVRTEYVVRQFTLCIGI